jgi:hypothetical protein
MYPLRRLRSTRRPPCLPLKKDPTACVQTSSHRVRSPALRVWTVYLVRTDAGHFASVLAHVRTGKEADGSSARLDSSIPVGRQGSVRDIAGAGVFLFSPAASFITGQVLVVDGGHRHTDENMLPYPQGVLDPGSVSKMIAAKL